jgi:hypothetical protein
MAHGQKSARQESRAPKLGLTRGTSTIIWRLSRLWENLWPWRQICKRFLAKERGRGGRPGAGGGDHDLEGLRQFIRENDQSNCDKCSMSCGGRACPVRQRRCVDSWPRSTILWRPRQIGATITFIKVRFAKYSRHCPSTYRSWGEIVPGTMVWINRPSGWNSLTVSPPLVPPLGASSQKRSY